MLSSIVSALAFSLELTFAFDLPLLLPLYLFATTAGCASGAPGVLNIERPDGPRSNILSIDKVWRFLLASVLPMVAVQFPALVSSRKLCHDDWSCMTVDHIMTPLNFATSKWRLTGSAAGFTLRVQDLLCSRLPALHLRSEGSVGVAIDHCLKRSCARLDQQSRLLELLSPPCMFALARLKYCLRRVRVEVCCAVRSSCTSMILEADPLNVDRPFLPHVDLRQKLQVPQGRK